MTFSGDEIYPDEITSGTDGSVRFRTPTAVKGGKCDWCEATGPTYYIGDGYYICRKCFDY